MKTKITVTFNLRDNSKALLVIFNNDDGWLQMDCYYREGNSEPDISYQVTDVEFIELATFLYKFGDML